MSCKIKIENFDKEKRRYLKAAMHSYSYFWICPSCHEDQVEFEEPEIGQTVRCEDCEIIVEVVR